MGKKQEQTRKQYGPMLPEALVRRVRIFLLSKGSSMTFGQVVEEALAEWLQRREGRAS